MLELRLRRITKQQKKNTESPLAPNWESEFTDGRRTTSPDNEQMEQTVTVSHLRNSESVE